MKNIWEDGRSQDEAEGLHLPVRLWIPGDPPEPASNQLYFYDQGRQVWSDLLCRMPGWPSPEKWRGGITSAISKRSASFTVIKQEGRFAWWDIAGVFWMIMIIRSHNQQWGVNDIAGIRAHCIVHVGEQTTRTNGSKVRQWQEGTQLLGKGSRILHVLTASQSTLPCYAQQKCQEMPWFCRTHLQLWLSSVACSEAAVAWEASGERQRFLRSPTCVCTIGSPLSQVTATTHTQPELRSLCHRWMHQVDRAIPDSQDCTPNLGQDGCLTAECKVCTCIISTDF